MLKLSPLTETSLDSSCWGKVLLGPRKDCFTGGMQKGSLRAVFWCKIKIWSNSPNMRNVHLLRVFVFFCLCERNQTTSAAGKWRTRKSIFLLRLYVSKRITEKWSRGDVFEFFENREPSAWSCWRFSWSSLQSFSPTICRFCSITNFIVVFFSTKMFPLGQFFTSSQIVRYNPEVSNCTRNRKVQKQKINQEVDKTAKYV